MNRCLLVFLVSLIAFAKPVEAFKKVSNKYYDEKVEGLDDFTCKDIKLRKQFIAKQVLGQIDSYMLSRSEHLKIMKEESPLSKRADFYSQLTDSSKNGAIDRSILLNGLTNAGKALGCW